MRERRYRAIILKKQPYGEGDELLTCFTLEQGKLRAMAKSTKYSRSKLQYSLQTLFEIQLTVSGRGLPKVIGAESVRTYSRVRESLEAAHLAFYAIELALKFTPDEQKNEGLFNTLSQFFSYLDAEPFNSPALQLGLAKFKIQFLEVLGLSLAYPDDPPGSGTLYFSNSKGSFLAASEGADHVPIGAETLRQYLALSRADFKSLPQLSDESFSSGRNTIELQEVLSGFLRYHLEREVKSERYLDVL